jgi:hypothetical protein
LTSLDENLTKLDARFDGAGASPATAPLDRLARRTFAAAEQFETAIHNAVTALNLERKSNPLDGPRSSA